MSVAATAMCGIASGLLGLELQTNAITLFPYTVQDRPRGATQW